MDPAPPKPIAVSDQQTSVIEYYAELAAKYDHDRFGNSYGAYVNDQERRILRQWLAPIEGTVLDLACGTGRLLEFATHGLDASPAMLQVAKSKHPSKPLHCAFASDLKDLGVQFDAIFSLHFFMHLPRYEIGRVLRACNVQLRPGGLCMFDVPSALRRKLTRFRPTGWHAGTALSRAEIRTLAGEGWRHKAERGILFFPIHRLPPLLRFMFRRFDDLLGASPLKPFCSYRMYCLEKQP